MTSSCCRLLCSVLLLATARAGEYCDDFENGDFGNFWTQGPQSTGGEWVASSYLELKEKTSDFPEPAYGDTLVYLTPAPSSGYVSARLEMVNSYSFPEGSTLSFRYWLRSQWPGSGTFEVHRVLGKMEESTPILSLTASSGPTNGDWMEANITLPTDDNAFKLLFFGACGTDEKDNIAIDDIKVCGPDGLDQKCLPLTTTTTMMTTTEEATTPTESTTTPQHTTTTQQPTTTDQTEGTSTAETRPSTEATTAATTTASTLETESTPSDEPTSDSTSSTASSPTEISTTTAEVSSSREPTSTAKSTHGPTTEPPETSSVKPSSSTGSPSDKTSISPTEPTIPDPTASQPTSITPAPTDGPVTVTKSTESTSRAPTTSAGPTASSATPPPPTPPAGQRLGPSWLLWTVLAVLGSTVLLLLLLALVRRTAKARSTDRLPLVRQTSSNGFGSASSSTSGNRGWFDYLFSDHQRNFQTQMRHLRQ